MNNILNRRGFILVPFAVLLAACVPKKHFCLDLTDFDEAARIGKQYAEHYKAHPPQYVRRDFIAELECKTARAKRIEQRQLKLIREQKQRFVASWSVSGVSA